MVAISDQADPAYVALLGLAESFRQVNNINECVRCLKVLFFKDAKLQQSTIKFSGNFSTRTPAPCGGKNSPATWGDLEQSTGRRAGQATFGAGVVCCLPIFYQISD